MSIGQQVSSTAINGLLAQADVALSEEPDKVAQLVEWFNQLPGMGWVIAGFVVFALVVAAIAKLTGNLDKIVSVFNKYFRKAETKLTEPELSMLRQKLLKQMTTDVALRLKDSLHNLVRVDLEQEEQLRQVGRRAARLVEAEPKRIQSFVNLISRKLAIFNNNKAIEPVEPVEKTYSIFRRPDIGGRLLILGEPGAGKTTELLTVAQRLVEAAIDDDNKPIPILFELSSWTPGTPILIWLGQQLKQTYGVSQKLAEPLAQQWIKQARILPLLDGLDELGQHNQSACIQSLEEFLAQHLALSVIVCCRREEYEQGGRQLKQLKGAIYLQAVGSAQIQKYLRDLGHEQLWSNIQAQPELLQLARSPLFLTLLVVTYQEQSIRDRETLFDAYIQKQLYEPSHNEIYKPGKGIIPEKNLRYLSWLASQLKQHQEAEFLIENLQPDWLASKQQKQIYKLTVGLFFGLFFGLVGWLIYGTFGTTTNLAMSGLIAGLTNGIIGGLIYGMIDGIIGGLMGGLLGGIRSGIFSGLLFGLAGGLLGGLRGGLEKIVPQEKLKWTFRNGLIGGLVFGLLSGLIIGLFGGLRYEIERGLVFGLLGGLIFGLAGGLRSGTGGRDYRTETSSQPRH